MGSQWRTLLIAMRSSPLHTALLGKSNGTNLGGKRDWERRDDRGLWQPCDSTAVLQGWRRE